MPSRDNEKVLRKYPSVLEINLVIIYLAHCTATVRSNETICHIFHHTITVRVPILWKKATDYVQLSPNSFSSLPEILLHNFKP